MKVKEILQKEVCYFAFELDMLHKKDCGIDEKYKFGYARMLNPLAYKNIIGQPFFTGIYDFFSVELVKKISTIKNNPFRIHQYHTTNPKLRGKGKWKYIGSESFNYLNLPYDLPHFFSFANEEIITDNQIFRYFKNGFDRAFSTFNSKDKDLSRNETEYKNLKHLNHYSGIYQPEQLFKFLIIEEQKKIDRNISEKELIKKIDTLYRLWGENWEDASEFDKKFDKKFDLICFKNLLKLPRYDSMPINSRERALNEVDESSE